jgi:diaminopimelate epimerase
VVAAAHAEDSLGTGEPWRVDVPGGTCVVSWDAEGMVSLTGPAVLVAEIEVADDWLASSAAVVPLAEAAG